MISFQVEKLSGKPCNKSKWFSAQELPVFHNNNNNYNNNDDDDNNDNDNNNDDHHHKNHNL